MTDKLVACTLCLESSPAQQRQIDIFSEQGFELNVSAIISKHFWLKPNSELHSGQKICWACWEALRDFHQFYVRIAQAHKHLERKIPFAVAEVEDDPLPHEVLLKSEEVNSAGKLVEALGDNFFDSGEVKVEVHDLDLLPQIEIIEGTTNLSDRAQRANRRGRSARASSEATTNIISKRIKRECSPYVNPSSDESEPEVPLAVLMNITMKTDSNDDVADSRIKRSANNVTGTKSSSKAEIQTKRRGRPKKVKEEKTDNSNAANPATGTNDDILMNSVKSEHEESESDAEDALNFLATGLESGTEDSADSSSESDGDSEKSLPDVKPKEKYAHIPKRVVVKPKKYRKRPKPLIPPKRMTREEIEAKKAQQAEYEKVIAKFFGKFQCPKCNLLVRNFGDMRKHFRASHNEDPGYMMCCGRKFHQRKVLAEHVYVHWNPEQFKCTSCEKLFQESRTLEVHELTHTNPPEPKEKKVFQCDKCPKHFTTKAAFEYHSFSKHVPKSEFKYSCTICNKKLPTDRKLKDHMRYMHDPESAIICDKCGKQVRSQSNLKKHHQIEHSDVPRPVPVPMQCEICGTWLRHIAGLKQHMKTIHEDSGGEHRCHICNKTSTNARALRRHVYHNHECERKFKCTMCEKAFKRPQDLREHTSTHTGEVLYTCPNCPMTFFSNANMYKHRQRLHRAEYEADRKKPVPPNIMQQAVGATAAMKMQQAVGATSAFFAHKLGKQANANINSQPILN